MFNDLRAYTSVILFLFWTSGVICRSTKDAHYLELESFIGISEDNDLANKSRSTIVVSIREDDAGYPEWENDLTFSFEQFPATNELNQAKRAMLGVIDMLQTTMAVMYPRSLEITQPWPAPTSNPSLERYFSIHNLPKVAEVFKRLLAALGAPGFSQLIDCYHDDLLTLKVVYGDYWGSTQPPLCQQEPDTSAYTSWVEDEDHPDGVFAIISLCQPFFINYKDFNGAVNMGLFNAPSIDSGITSNTYQLPCYTSSLTFLHELLHWGAMGHSTLGYVIGDQVIYDPRYRAQTEAYRAFYSMKMLDWTNYNTERWTALSNVDNYVYAVQEIYWGVRTRRQRVWEDPSPVPGYYPVGAPPPPGGA